MGMMHLSHEPRKTRAGYFRGVVDGRELDEQRIFKSEWDGLSSEGKDSHMVGAWPFQHLDFGPPAYTPVRE